MRTIPWILLLGGVLLLSLALLLLPQLHASTVSIVAEIYQDGTLVQTIDLSAITEATTLPLCNGDRENTLLAEPGRIAMQSANCPDGLCVHQGFVSDSSTPIVCLPNRVVVKVTHPQPGAADAITQ